MAKQLQVINVKGAVKFLPGLWICGLKGAETSSIQHGDEFHFMVTPDLIACSRTIMREHAKRVTCMPRLEPGSLYKDTT